MKWGCKSKLSASPPFSKPLCYAEAYKSAYDGSTLGEVAIYSMSEIGIWKSLGGCKLMMQVNKDKSKILHLN